MAHKRPLVAVINSDLTFLQMMADILEDEGYDALIMEESGAAFEVIKQRMPALVVIEMLLTDPERGWMVLNKMRLDPRTTIIPVIVASTATDLIQRNEKHLREKRCDILLKPFDLEELLAMVEKHIDLTEK